MSATESSSTTATTDNLEADAVASLPPQRSVEELIAALTQARNRVLPIMQQVVAEYEGRTRRGYPRVIDNVERGGVFGLTLDPGYAVYILTDGTAIFAELHATHPRSDTLSAANVEKFAGRPTITRMDVDETWNDRDYRNLISMLLNRWNYQQLRVFRVDS